MKIYRLSSSQETWLDSRGQIVYIKGIPYKEPRLTRVEFGEAQSMQTGSVTKTLSNGSTITYYPPFRKKDEVFKQNNEEYRSAITDAARRYDLYTGDAWRCDFCEPNCNCDQQFLEGLAEEIYSKFPYIESFDQIEDDIYNAMNL